MKGIHPQTITIDQITIIVGLKLGSNLLQVEIVEVQERILLLQKSKSNQKTTKKRKWWIS